MEKILELVAIWGRFYFHAFHANPFFMDFNSVFNDTGIFKITLVMTVISGFEVALVGAGSSEMLSFLLKKQPPILKI